MARISAEYYPFVRKRKKGLQIIANHSYRRLDGFSEFIDDLTQLFELSVNYCFDEEGHVGLGVDYQN